MGLTKFHTIQRLAASILPGVLIYFGSLNALNIAGAQSNQQPPVRDAVGEAQQSTRVQAKRPEQTKTPHDNSDVFAAPQAKPQSPAFNSQPKAGKNSGFDFYRDPLNADRPFDSPDAIMQKLLADKPRVMEAQRKLLESRYNLQPRLDPQAKMSRGKPLVVGPTAKLQGTTWEQIGGMAPEEIGRRGIFPYPSLPHPLQANGGQTFPKMQIEMFPRLERVDVDFDLPEVFLPSFHPPFFFRTVRSWAMSREARSSLSTTITGSSRTSLLRCNSMGCACCSRPFHKRSSTLPMIGSRRTRVWA